MEADDALDNSLFSQDSQNNYSKSHIWNDGKAVVKINHEPYRNQ